MSEAVAKLRFSYIVAPEHVEEACNIFKSSLSKIRYTDIDLGEMDGDQEELEEQECLKGNVCSADGQKNDSGNSMRPSPSEITSHAVSGNRKKASTTIGYNEYFQIARRFVERLQNEEDGDVSTADLVTWHISEYDHPESEEELAELEEKYHRAIQRMIHRDMILYISFQEEIATQKENSTGERKEGEDENAEVEEEVVLLTYVKVHPNFNAREAAIPMSASSNSGGNYACLTRHADFGYRTFQNVEGNLDSRSNEVVERENEILNLNENLEPEDFLPDINDPELDNEYRNNRDGIDSNRGEEDGEYSHDGVSSSGI